VVIETGGRGERETRRGGEEGTRREGDGETGGLGGCNWQRRRTRRPRSQEVRREVLRKRCNQVKNRPEKLSIYPKITFGGDFDYYDLYCTIKHWVTAVALKYTKWAIFR
jgi:hypothetical protein